MQSIGSSPDRHKLYIQGRCKAIGTPRTDEEKQQIFSAKNRELKIAELRKEGGVKHSFEEIVDKKVEKAQLQEKIETIEKLMAEKKEEVVEPVKVEPKEPNIEEARETYKEKTGNDVPNRFKNSLDWIMSKI